jgi:alpha-galactosidase/6-phospho-beta-glucosidase family protein
MVQNLCIVLLLATIGCAASVRSVSSVSDKTLALEQQWSQELDQDSKETPIQRVVRLLTEMKSQLEKEAEADAELYDQMVCWCETNEKEKTKAIADADAKDKDLTSEIEERSARFGVLATEIEATKKLIAEETQALAEATALREKEYGEFTEEEKDMIQAITNLKNAVQVLSKHHGGSLLQLTPQVMTSLHAVLQDAAYKHEMLMGDDDLPKRSSMQAALISIQQGQGAASTRLRGLQDRLM